MRILIILAHPDRHSFNHAIANECKQRLAENGHKIIFHDLHEEHFDPLITSTEIPKNGKINDLVKKHCDDLIQSDGIIIVHPNWWGQPPAILKGWIDRIIRPGIAYEFLDGDNGEGTPIGLLKAKTGLVFNTSNTNADRENNIFGDPLETIWKNCIFDFCGVKQFDRKMFRVIVTSDLEQRNHWLKETRELIDKYFPEN
jgi:NAD(P)H dehydrogenase (quinone)